MYFYITDLVRQKEVEAEYCSSDYMLADYMTNPLTGEKFVRNRNIMINMQLLNLASRNVLT